MIDHKQLIKNIHIIYHYEADCNQVIKMTVKLHDLYLIMYGTDEGLKSKMNH